MIWNIDPILIDLGILQIRYYSICWFFGLIIANEIAKKTKFIRSIPKEKVENILIFCVISTILGAHIVHLVFYEPTSLINNPIRLVQIGSGLASHGGVLGAILGLYIFSKRLKLEFYSLADIATFSAGFTCGFIRIGNFFNSEILGNATDSPFGIIFLRVSPIPRHPAQLYEAAFLFTISSIAAWYYFRNENSSTHVNGFIFLTFLFFYFSFRIFVELIKEHQSEMESLTSSFTMGQFLSIPYVILAGYHLFKQYRKRLKEPK